MTFFQISRLINIIAVIVKMILYYCIIEKETILEIIEKTNFQIFEHRCNVMTISKALNLEMATMTVQ